MQPIYTPDFEYGSTHPDPTEVLNTVDYLIEHVDPMPTTHIHRVLRGLAGRDDLTTAHLDRLAAMPADSSRSLRVALLMNPALREYPAVRNLIDLDLINDLLSSPHPDWYVNEIIRLVNCAPHEDQGERLLDRIVEVLGAEAIEDHFVRACGEPSPDALVETAQHPMLTATGFDLLLDRINAFRATSRVSHASAVYAALCRRHDLTDEQGLALVALGHRLASEDTRLGRWVFLDLIQNRNAPAVAQIALLRHRAKSIRHQVLYQPHITPETIFAAVRAHMPHALSALTSGAVPEDIADIALTDLEAGQARGATVTPDGIQRIAEVIMGRCPTPSVWERTLALYQSCGLFDDTTEAVRAFYKHARTPAHLPRIFGGSAPRDEFLSWAAAHHNPNLRAQVVSSLVLPHDLCAAATDPSPVVRAAVARHPMCAPAALVTLAQDSDPAIRLTVVEHPRVPTEALALLVADTDEAVRAAAADRFVTVLA